MVRVGNFECYQLCNSVRILANGETTVLDFPKLTPAAMVSNLSVSGSACRGIYQLDEGGNEAIGYDT
jgi:hypothetical protein